MNSDVSAGSSTNGTTLPGSIVAGADTTGGRLGVGTAAPATAVRVVAAGPLAQPINTPTAAAMTTSFIDRIRIAPVSALVTRG